MPGDMLTTREVAKYLGIHEKQVYRLLRQRRLPGTRITGRWIFPPARDRVDRGVLARCAEVAER